MSGARTLSSAVPPKVLGAVVELALAVVESSFPKAELVALPPSPKPNLWRLYLLAEESLDLRDLPQKPSQVVLAGVRSISEKGLR